MKATLITLAILLGFAVWGFLRDTASDQRACDDYRRARAAEKARRAQLSTKNTQPSPGANHTQTP